MRTTEIITISLPPEMAKLFEAVRKSESRTRSELVREALRDYFNKRFPVVQPTKQELKALREGRAAYQRGEYVTFEQLHDELEALLRQPRKRRF